MILINASIFLKYLTESFNSIQCEQLIKLTKEKNMIRLLVDSASDYTQEEIRNKNLYFVPLQIQIEGKNYLDGVDIDKETFYEKMMNSKEFFKTSQPSPQEFLDIFEEVKKKQETLICLSLSSKLSGTYQSACLAKDMVDYENIYIVDTLTAVAGIRLLCEVAINWIDENRSVENIVSGLEELKEHVHIYAGLDTLEYLAKGGRISKTAAAIGTLASIKPIICVEHGEVVVAGKTRGVNKATSVVCEKMQSDIVDTLYPVYTLYSYGLENVEKLESKLDFDVERVRIGSTIGVHIGPNAFGVCFVSKL